MTNEYANDECLECGCEIPEGEAYCDECYERLDREGFFEGPSTLLEDCDPEDIGR